MANRRCDSVVLKVDDVFDVTLQTREEQKSYKKSVHEKSCEGRHARREREKERLRSERSRKEKNSLAS